MGVPVGSEAMTKRRGRDVRADLFEIGAAALERVLGVNDVYACPLCLDAHSRECLAMTEPHLTIEDVPPKSVGGRPLVLTCKTCNNEAGTKLDAKLAERADLMRALKGEKATRPPKLTATFAVGPDRNEVQLSGLPGPGPSIRFHAEAVRRKLGGPAQATKVTIPLNDRQVQLSMLRAAFLGAFAQLGYRYALCSQLDVVRQQLAEPDDQVIGQWVFYLVDPAMRRERFFMEIVEPVPCLAALWDGFAVFLPVHESPAGWESFVGGCPPTFPHDHQPTNMHGTDKWPWPKQMTMKWDQPADDPGD